MSREFWIIDFESGRRQVSEKPVTYDTEFFGEPDFSKAVLPRDIIHVREVEDHSGTAKDEK